MSEKSKMLSQKYYNSWDEELVQEREHAKSLLFKFNSLNPFERNQRLEVLNELIPNIGQNPWIESPFNCDYGTNMEIGDYFYANTNFTVLDCGPVSIGKNVLIGPNVSLYTVNHAIDSTERVAGLEKALPINVADNVWLGGSVVVLGGVSIGKNSVIGAGSVVTHDIPDNVVAIGNPARILRKITIEDKIS